MFLNNSFNILPWYDSLEKQSSKKWYAFGQSWPLLCPKGAILPFQFVCEALEITSNIQAVNVNTNEITDLGVTPSVIQGSQPNSTYYVVKLASAAVPALPVGTYYLRFNTSLGYLYSEEITIIDDSSECIKIQYWNEDTLNFASGEINFADNFKFEFYIRSTIGKPEYEFEEELTKRLGYKFIESQTSNKVYKFAFVAPEYICDAMRLIRLCDYVKLTTKFDSYNALSFAYEPKWQDQGDLAAVDVEFDTDCIIQKLESFNRRIKESFYNALLADIDEPVLFSTDTVAQYYTEFTTTSFINGKLIRQLESILPNELQSNFVDLVLPIDNMADDKNTAKKVSLPDLMSLVNSSDISKLFKGHFDADGNLQWIEALSHIGVNGGVTMFIDNGSMSLPQLYAGLPIDGSTLIRDDNGVLMINPDINLGGGASTWDELIGKPTWIGSTKPSYNYSEILQTPDLSVYALAKDLEKYVTLNTEQTIAAHKNFLNGLSVGGLGITKSQDDVIYLDANLVVRGGITMYAEGEVDIPSILDSLPIASNTAKGIASFDSSYFSVDSNGKVTLLAENVGLNETELFDYLSRNNYAKKSDIPSLSGYATETYVEDRLDDLINGAPAAYDTLKEIADVLQGNVNSIGDIITTLGNKADKATTLAGYGITDAYTSAKVDELLGDYVTIKTTQTITGEKNFTGGLKVNGSPIVYDATNKYWKLEGDLLVTGGVTMFASDSAFTPSTIMDAIATDGTNLKVVNGVLTFVGSIDGGEAGSVAWENVTGKPSFASVATSGKYSDLSGAPTLLSSFTNDVGFITSYVDTKNTAGSTNTSSKIFLIGATSQAANPQTYSHDTAYVGTDGYLYSGGAKVLTSHQTIYNLTLQAGAFSAATFDPNGANKTVNIPTTTSHITEGDNLYYTNARAQAAITGGASTIVTSDLTTNRALISNASGKVAVSAVTSTELSYLDGVTSAIQTQLNSKLAATSYTAADVLAKLLTVDGASSGLDADLLDGLQPSALSVLSASKLTTARTIWGQSFDGSGDVNGAINIKGNLGVYQYSTENELLMYVGYSVSNKNVYLYNGKKDSHLSLFDDGRISLIGGNVLIGSTTDSGYKLDVNGTLGVTGAATLKSTLLVASDTTIATKLTLNGIPIYKSQDDVLYIDGNLAVRGGITMYATDAIDIPSIIEALPPASSSVKGIAAFNPNDFSVVDGYVSFIGSSGVDESVLANYAKKTDLSAYLPLSGGQMTGNIGYTLSPDSYAVGLPAAGAISYSTSFTDIASNCKTFLGSVYDINTTYWYNMISVRHTNGSGGDGNRYGMYIYSDMLHYNYQNLIWNTQINGIWQGERVILDSVNWSQYVTTSGGGSYLPLTGGTLNGPLSFIGGAIGRFSNDVMTDSFCRIAINAANNSPRGYIGYYKDHFIYCNFNNSIENSVISLYDDGWCQFTPGMLFMEDTNVGNTSKLSYWGLYAWNDTFEICARNSDRSYKKSVMRLIYNSGDMLITGGITMYSDIRKKTKLKDVELSLKQIADAPLIEHYYNSDSNKTTHVGSIAQYWAGLNDWFCKPDNDGFYTMEIQNAALASAISIARELVKYESKTDKEIRLLKDEVKRLKKEIKILKAA